MSEATKSHILGRVEWINDGGRCGRIRLLALVKKRQDGDWVVDREVEDQELGESGHIFWPKIPNHQLRLMGQYVRFKVAPNLRTRDRDDESWDDFVVAGDDSTGSARAVEVIGWPVLAADHVNTPERVVSPRAGHLPIGTSVYRRRPHDYLIDGPWLIAQRPGNTSVYLQPKQEGYVVEHLIARLPRETYRHWNDGRDAHTMLLVEPSAAMGQLRDLLTAPELANWLVRFLRREKSLLASLDKAAPGWRDRLGALVEETTDPIRRRLEQGRLARLTPALDALAASEARLNELIETPQFKVVLDKAVADEIRTRRDLIEAAATGETRAFVAQQKQVREQEQARSDRAKQNLIDELAEIRVEIKAAERRHAEAQAVVERDETAVRAAADHLVESRERITRDFFAFHGLVEATKAHRDGPTNGAANGHAAIASPSFSAVSKPALADRPTPIGPAIDESMAFLKGRLAPALAAWGAHANFLQARNLHAVLLACRWVAAPCPSWGVAYAEAIGGHAQHRVVAAEATWLTFADAWAGEVEAFWRDAVAQPDILYILIVADADRALVQCWARPLLDLAAGLRSTLPTGEGWPANLRIMACPAADDAAWPTPDWVVSHWSGVEATTSQANSGTPIVTGHVPFATWSTWIGEADTAPHPSAGLGAATRAAARERSALAWTLQRLDPHTDLEAAELAASRLREGDARRVFAARGDRA